MNEDAVNRLIRYKNNEITELNVQNDLLRADVERIRRELATMTAANAELNARLTLCEAAK